jgi:hypothetical protein
VSRDRYEWLSRRSHKLEELTISISDFHQVHFDEIDLSSIQIYGVRSNAECIMNALSVLQLIKCNPRVKKLEIIEDKHEYTSDDRILRYLSQYCQEANEVIMTSASAEALRLVMAGFPNLTTVKWSCYRSLIPFPALAEIDSFPSIISLDIHAQYDVDAGVISSLIKACPNLTSLKAVGLWIFQIMNEIIAPCSSLTSLDLSYYNWDQYNLAPMISALADDGLRLKELRFHFPSINMAIDLRNALTRYNLIRTIKRLRSCTLNVELQYNAADPDTSIYSLFSSRDDVDLRSLTMSTHDEDADRIAIMLQGCRNARRLDLNGRANASQVMIAISNNCRQLVVLYLRYESQVDGEAMRRLLQSCHLLTSLFLITHLDIQAHESLALYGGNLTKLRIFPNETTEIIESLSFDPNNSPIYDLSFRQQRKYPMKLLMMGAYYLDVKSLAKFFSSFGLIEALYFELYPSLLPSDMDVQAYTQIPIYHARHVDLNCVESSTYRYDSVALAMMSACRSMRTLSVASDQCFADESSLIICAFTCSMKNPFQELRYPMEMDISQVKYLLPKLKLNP